MQPRAVTVGLHGGQDCDEEHRRELEELQEKLTTQQEKLADERARHSEALRDQKAKLRVDAAREATTRVEKDLRAKERMIGKMKKQIDEQSRQLEHMTPITRRSYSSGSVVIPAMCCPFGTSQISFGSPAAAGSSTTPSQHLTRRA